MVGAVPLEVAALAVVDLVDVLLVAEVTSPLLRPLLFFLDHYLTSNVQ